MQIIVLALALVVLSANASNLRTSRAEPGGLSDATKAAIAVQGSAAVTRDANSESVEVSVVREHVGEVEGEVALWPQGLACGHPARGSLPRRLIARVYSFLL